jgi:WD40 repeat protein
LRGHLLEVVSAEFDPSGKRVVTASHDGTVKIWSATTGSLAVKLRGHVENANGASFSRPDGRLVVSAGDDDTARLWDASTGGLVSLFSAPGTVMRADIQPGGGKILIVGGDGRARLYNCVACTPDRALLTQAKALVHRRLTPAERKKYP